MAARESALRCLSRLFGRSGREAALEDDLVAMRREHDYWCRCAEDAEKASDFSQKQASAAFEQARLLSMYIPSACPEDTPGAGPSSRPLEEHLVPPRGGSGVMPASAHSVGEHRSRARSCSPVHSCFHPGSPGTIFGDMVVDFAQPSEPSRPSLAGRLEEPKETMFPLLGRGEVPNRIQVLLDSKKFLHIQFNDCVYQFKEPRRRDVLRISTEESCPPLLALSGQEQCPCSTRRLSSTDSTPWWHKSRMNKTRPTLGWGRNSLPGLTGTWGTWIASRGKSPPKPM